ncbi:hypothetical protein CP533_5347, partial [Ophiocordyceps camponoti-saundersi (nom. inval.)]
MSSPSTKFDLAYAAADLGPDVRGFCIAMTVVTVLSILLRLLSHFIARPSQARTGRRFWLDDWFALAAAPFVLAQLGLSFSAIRDGFGHHQAVLPGPRLLRIAKDIFIVYFLYDGALFFTKASALEFLRRIFPSQASPRWFNICLWLGHGINLAWLIGLCFGTTFMCNPIAKHWNASLPGHCEPTSGIFIGSAASSVFIDIFILVLPLPRLIDAAVPVVYWVTAEPAVSMLVVCLPAMLPLGRFLLKNYFAPLASFISVALSSKNSPGSRGSRRRQIRSRSGDFTTSTVEIHNKDPKQPSTPRQGSTTTQDEGPYDLESLRPVQTQKSVLR